MRSAVYLGTAGWSIPKANASSVSSAGTGLERYSSALNAVEINTTFYRRHRVSTFERWSAAVPDSFRFAVKLPRTITHDAALASPSRPLREFLDDVRGLGTKLGPILVQLPASVPFNLRRSTIFFRTLRRLHEGPVVCEPRHASWYEPVVTALLTDLRVGRVAADPPRPSLASSPAGYDGVLYYRLHGSPQRYWSSYDDESLRALRQTLRTKGPETSAWCIFDNTASGAAFGNALSLRAMMR